MGAATVFISYAHQDTRWRKDIEDFLRVLVLDGRLNVEVWSDKELAAGDDWQARISATMERAKIGIVIVTKSFLNSEFIRREELPFLTERAAQKQLRLVPLLAEPCPWELIRELDPVQLRPTGGQALAQLGQAERQRELSEFVKEIFALLEPREAAPRARLVASPAAPTTHGRSAATLELVLRHYRGTEYLTEFVLSGPDETHLTHYKAQLAIEERPVDLASAQAYARRLDRGLFPDGAPREAASRFHDIAESATVTMRINIDPTARDLHDIMWETLPLAFGSDDAPYNDAYRISRFASRGNERWPDPPIRPSSEQRVGMRVLTTDAAILDDPGLQATRDAMAASGIVVNGPTRADAPGELVAGGDCIVFAAVELTRDAAQPRLAFKAADADGYGAIDGEELSATIVSQNARFQLLILDTPAVDPAREAALPRLASELIESGVCAVLTRQAGLANDAWNGFLTAFLQGLGETGNLELAFARGRAGLGPEDTWKPQLLTRLRTGQMQYEPHFVVGEQDTWTNLVRRVNAGKCIPVIGPSVRDFFTRSRRAIAEAWADDIAYPMAPNERGNLRKVAQYVATMQEPDAVIDQFSETLKRYARKRYSTDGVGRRKDAPIGTYMQEIWDSVISQHDRGLFQLLARLRAPVYLTTAFHNFLSTALAMETGRDGNGHAGPRDRILSLDRGFLGMEEDADDAGFSLSRDQPMVYYLFGRVDRQGTLVLTEDDHFRFLLKWVETFRSLPIAVQDKFSESALLFLGFSLESWDFRALFRSVLELEGAWQQRKKPHVAVQIDPDDDRIRDPERTRDYLVQYFRQISERPQVFIGSTRDFLEELDNRLDSQ